MSSAQAPPVFIRVVRSISGGGGTFDGSHTFRNEMVLTRRPPTDAAPSDVLEGTFCRQSFYILVGISFRKNYCFVFF